MLYKVVWDYFTRDGKRVLFPHNHGPCQRCFNEAHSRSGTKRGLINPLTNLIEIHDSAGEELLTTLHEFLHLAARAYALATGSLRVYDSVYGENRPRYEPDLVLRCISEDKIDRIAEDIMHNNPHLVRYIVKNVPELQTAP